MFPLNRPETVDAIYVVPVYPRPPKDQQPIPGGRLYLSRAGEPAGPYEEHEVESMRRALVAFAEAGAQVAFRVEAPGVETARSAVAQYLHDSHNRQKTLRMIDLEDYQCPASPMDVKPA